MRQLLFIIIEFIINEMWQKEIIVSKNLTDS